METVSFVNTFLLTLFFSVWFIWPTSLATWNTVLQLVSSRLINCLSMRCRDRHSPHPPVPRPHLPFWDAGNLKVILQVETSWWIVMAAWAAALFSFFNFWHSVYACALGSLPHCSVICCSLWRSVLSVGPLKSIRLDFEHARLADWRNQDYWT